MTRYELRQVIYPDGYVVHEKFLDAKDALDALSDSFSPGDYYLVRIEEKVIARRVVGKDNQRYLDRIGEIVARRKK